MKNTEASRRKFLTYFSSVGLGGTLLPGVLWATMQESGTQQITQDMLKNALKLSGLSFTDEDEKAMLESVNDNLERFETFRKIKIPNDVSPPFHFSALVPGMTLNRTRQPFRMSTPSVKRPANLQDIAYWPVTNLAQLIKTRQVTSTELTRMYLDRMHKYGPKLNCVVTILDELGMTQAKQADADIAAGKYKGPLHGIPWGAKDIIAVKGYKTTWGSAVYKDQMLDYDASVVEMLRDAGAVLIAKLTTGELASGDNWFGGQTKNPWNTSQGSSGSSAGPGAATAAGLVGFSIGTETSGSIISPSSRCGVTGLRPTLGRVSRYGAMVLSWTQDRLGPMCRYAEDCALVMSVISRPDGRDLSVMDIPFNWNVNMDIRKLRVGYIKDAFESNNDPVAKRNQDKVVEVLESLGVQLIPVTVPDFTTDVSASGIEAAVFFEDLVRTGRFKEMTNPSRANSWRNNRALPAVEYLQSQRIRMMLMMKLAEATRDVDVYLGPGTSGNVGGGGRGGRGERGERGQRGERGGRGAANATPQNAGQRHSTMANLATYPALAVPNGFNDAGNPTSITFFARPFGEMELLALGKAYQDVARFHLKQPNLDPA
ncbi:MAG: amidase [Acidobacteria bacterium]|nr:amidase [Acidobacteriota bacterium]